MSKRTPVLLPQTARLLKQMGENIRLARLRRNLQSSLVAERADISLSTLTRVEHGEPSVSMGAYARVLLAVNLDKDILKVGADDVLGHTLQDLNMNIRARASRRRHV